VHENNVPTIVVLLGQDAGNASEFATCDWMETLTRLQTEVTLTPDAENLVKKLRSELEKARQKEQGVLEDVMRVVQAFKSDMEKKKIADAEYCRELERTAKNIYETQDRLNQQHLEIQRDLKERLEDREARLVVREEELRMRNKDIEQLRKQIDEM
jgi:chromosome segregation ATPase